MQICGGVDARGDELNTSTGTLELMIKGASDRFVSHDREFVSSLATRISLSAAKLAA